MTNILKNKNQGSQEYQGHPEYPESNDKREILEGFKSPQKRISSKYLYDKRGSELFEQICDLDEYYLTRTEIDILNACVGEVANYISERATLLEFGSGSSVKTRILLDQLDTSEAMITYVPIDISKNFLLETAQKLEKEYTQVRISPICADFTQPLSIAEHLTDEEPDKDKKLVFFPGSTIGNFEPEKAQMLLKQTGLLLGRKGLLLIGVDLIKEASQLEAAYNDAKGVTAAFNLNLLTRLNLEYSADFNLSQFAHKAVFNRQESRMEMHLVSLTDQWVRIAETPFYLHQGETIHTENSYKYDFDAFEKISQESGFAVIHRWTDPNQLFAVYLLEATSHLSVVH